MTWSIINLQFVEMQEYMQIKYLILWYTKWKDKGGSLAVSWISKGCIFMQENNIWIEGIHGRSNKN